MERELLLASDRQIEEGTLQRITVNDIDFCVTRLNGAVCVLEDRCPHMSAPFSYGSLEGSIITCPQHRAQFDLSDLTLVTPAVMGGGNRAAAMPPPATIDPEVAAQAERRRQMMGSVRTKPLVVFPVVERDGNVYVLLPNEA